MKTISVRAIKTELSHLLEEVGSGKLTLREGRAKLGRLLEAIDSGEEIVITREGQAIARVVPLK